MTSPPKTPDFFLIPGFTRGVWPPSVGSGWLCRDFFLHAACSTHPSLAPLPCDPPGEPFCDHRGLGLPPRCLHSAGWFFASIVQKVPFFFFASPPCHGRLPAPPDRAALPMQPPTPRNVRDDQNRVRDAPFSGPRSGIFLIVMVYIQPNPFAISAATARCSKTLPPPPPPAELQELN